MSDISMVNVSVSHKPLWVLKKTLKNLDPDNFQQRITSEAFAAKWSNFKLDIRIDREKVFENDGTLIIRIFKEERHSCRIRSVNVLIFKDDAKCAVEFENEVNDTNFFVAFHYHEFDESWPKVVVKLGCQYNSASEAEFFLQVTQLKDEGLLAQIETSYKRKMYSDFKLVCDGQVFMSNRYILSIRSQVFRAMLSMDTSENRRGKIEINDFGADTIQSMLKFMHTDKIDDDEINVDLLVAADKYDVKLLFFVCEEKLVADVQTSNAIHCYVVASQLCAKDLLLKSAKVIFENFPTLRAHTDFDHLTKEHLAEIMSFASSNFNEKRK